MAIALFCFVLFFVSFHKVRPPIMVESIIERHSHSRVEYLVKVGVELVWTIHEHTMNTHTMSHSDVLHLSSPPTLLSLPSPLLSLLFPSSPLQRKGSAAAEDGEGNGREQLCKVLAGAAAAREVRQQPAPPHREPASEGAGE